MQSVQQRTVPSITASTFLYLPDAVIDDLPDAVIDDLPDARM